MKNILIKNGTLVTAETSVSADVLIAEGKIADIASSIESAGAEVIDASGCYLLPGGIDVHVHMELPVGGGMVSADDFESGTRAALAGGTTSIIDFVTPERGQSLPEAVRSRKEAAAKSLCDYGLHMSVTEWNHRTAAEMTSCLEQEGMSSVKLYMAYKQAVGLDDADILRVMDAAAGLGVLVMVHCEHGETVDYLREKFIREGKTEPRFHPLSRPAEVEVEAVKRAIVMANAAGCGLYIVHVSTSGALKEIAEAKAAGSHIWAETCPHYLLLDESAYQFSHKDTQRNTKKETTLDKSFSGGPGGRFFKKAPLAAGGSPFSYVMSPPLRNRTDRDSLWIALRSGLVKVASTDHCPFTMAQKERGNDDFTRIPNGIAGVGERMMLLYTYGVGEDKLSLQRFVDITATQPAKIFGLYPRKGVVAVGSDADVVIWDPLAEGVLETGIYKGIPVKGKPRIVFANGTIAYQNGKVTTKPGSGRYLERTPFLT